MVWRRGKCLPSYHNKFEKKNNNKKYNKVHASKCISTLKVPPKKLIKHLILTAQS